jgi:caa(3)-type oxidase subunit IV
VVPVWLGLLGLLVLTVAGAHLPLGSFNVVLALGIAATKALLVGLFFMHLRRPDPLLRLAASAAGLWILFLFALSFADLLTRPAASQPGIVQPRSADPASRSTEVRPF